MPTNKRPGDFARLLRTGKLSNGWVELDQFPINVVLFLKALLGFVLDVLRSPFCCSNVVRSDVRVAELPRARPLT